MSASRSTYMLAVLSQGGGQHSIKVSRDLPTMTKLTSFLRRSLPANHSAKPVKFFTLSSRAMLQQNPHAHNRTIAETYCRIHNCISSSNFIYTRTFRSSYQSGYAKLAGHSVTCMARRHAASLTTCLTASMYGGSSSDTQHLACMQFRTNRDLDCALLKS